MKCQRHVKHRFVEVLSILADVSQQDTSVLKHSILSYFSYRSVITSLELISLNLTLTNYEHVSQSYYRRLRLSIWLEQNMVFQYDKMTRGDLHNNLRVTFVWNMQIFRLGYADRLVMLVSIISLFVNKSVKI